MWTKWRGGIAKKLMGQANAEAVKKTLDVVGEEATTQVPHDEGTLQSSQYIDVQTEGGVVKGIISYGGGAGTGFPKVPYAIKWHELDADFQKGRKKNYLRDPWNKLAKPTYKRALQQEGRSRL